LTDRPTDEQREALIATEVVGALEPVAAAELALLAELLADESTWTEPSAALEAAVVRAVADTDPLADTPATTGDAAALGAAKPRRRRSTLSFVAAAAAVALLLGTVAEARRTASADFTAELRATGLAPGAHASADVTRNDAGFRVVLDARGLPPLRPGEYYQAWLKNRRGTLVPIGTFSSSDGRVTLWSGVEPLNFPVISVTIEAADNHQTSSGRRVLTGVLHVV
jgi:Anti-sigma-K factor rskA